jgi:toxin ParE1/3/4
VKIRYTRTALAEIDEICGYIRRDNPRAAAEVAVAIERAVAWIARHPQSAPVVFENAVRAKLVGRFQYRIFYVVDDRELIIRNVRSTKRRRPWEAGES